ncbi:signal recognition particle, SRP19 subunit [Backusella circina FSU 941]|nr:signal recognition particle, SRP19 subunit [Backusella circina FSU 941]
MSMLNNLKKTKKNHVFLDDDDDLDIDNMDFPLPDAPSASSSSAPLRPNPAGGMPNMEELQKMMQSLGGGAAEVQRPSVPTIASGPGGQIRQMSPDEYKDWVCVYPCYINSEKSYQEGRKIAKSKAVKNPHAYHMAVAVQKLGLTVVYEGKRHPRDWANVGRVRVQLKNQANFFINQSITSRKELFVEIAKILPECEKEGAPPNTMLSPLTTLSEIEALADEQRKAQGLPTLAELQASQQAANPQPQIPAKQKKQKIKYMRG